MLSEGDEDDTAGIEDRPHPHRDRLTGDVPFAEEVAGGVGPRDVVERDQPGATLRGAPRLVEADVAGAADAEDLQIDPTGSPDRLLVLLTGGKHVLPGERSIGDVDRLGGDVEMIEEMLAHEAVVALQRAPIHRPVFVEIKGHNAAERDPFLAMEADQLVVDADRRAPGGEAEDGLPAGRGARLNELCDLPGDGTAGIARLLVDRHRQPLDRAAVLMRRLREGPAIDRKQSGGGAGPRRPTRGCWLCRHGGPSVDPRGTPPPKTNEIGGDSPGLSVQSSY